MRKLHIFKWPKYLGFLLAIVLTASCNLETKKAEVATSNSSDEKVAQVEVEDVEVLDSKDTKSSQPLSNLKTKDLIYAWVDQLNVRDNPSIKGNVIASIDRDAAVAFTGIKSGDVETIVLRGVAYEDLWYKIVTADGQEGWVFGGAIKRKEESKGNTSITAIKFSFPHFGDFDLSTWKKLETKTENDVVDYVISTYQKGERFLEITSSDMGETHYGYVYKLKDKEGKIIKERNFRFQGDGKVLEEKVRDYTTKTAYTRNQTLKKHWYQLNAKPLMVNGDWTKSVFE